MADSDAGRDMTGSDAERARAAADRRQRALGVESGAARAAVLGINDGLVTNTSLILGVFGAASPESVIQMAGFASLVAGACSMAVGEYVSMRAQEELLTRLLDDERKAMQEDPGREREVIRVTLEQHGFDRPTAEAGTKELARNPEKALGVYARAVLGVNPDELGSPWTAAFSSFVAFAAGAFLPLLPWLFAGRSAALAASLVLSGVAALGIGGALGYLSNRHVAWSALRQLFVVALASAVTYGVGKLFGVLAP
jgi:VIT1/CCC1 family predicted Fe2+/Mn2+ transporter